MFWTRFKSAAVFVPLVLALAYVGGVAYSVLILAVMGVATWEYWRLLKTMGYVVSLPLMLTGVFLLLGSRALMSFEGMELSLMLIILATLVFALVRYEKADHQAVLSFALHLSGIFYLGWLGGYFFSLRALPDGRWWLMLVMGLVWLVDLGAYIIGSNLGKHKMYPLLSPKKSWEGFGGGLLFGAVFGGLISLLLRPVLPQLTLWEGVALGLVIGLISPFGDVFVSLLKRVAGVKDSSNLIPGHGGVLDRTDTWMWAVMVGYFLVSLIG